MLGWLSGGDVSHACPDLARLLLRAVARRRPPASVLVAMGHDQCEAPKHPSECISQRQADHKEAAGSNREEDQGGREGGGGREEGGAPRRKASQGQDRPTIDIKASGDKQ